MADVDFENLKNIFAKLDTRMFFPEGFDIKDQDKIKEIVEIVLNTKTNIWAYHDLAVKTSANLILEQKSTLITNNTELNMVLMIRDQLYTLTPKEANYIKHILQKLEHNYGINYFIAIAKGYEISKILTITTYE